MHLSIAKKKLIVGLTRQKYCVLLMDIPKCEAAIVFCAFHALEVFPALEDHPSRMNSTIKSSKACPLIAQWSSTQEMREKLWPPALDPFCQLGTYW